MWKKESLLFWSFCLIPRFRLSHGYGPKVAILLLTFFSTRYFYTTWEMVSVLTVGAEKYCWSLELCACPAASTRYGQQVITKCRQIGKDLLYWYKISLPISKELYWSISHCLRTEWMPLYMYCTIRMQFSWLSSFFMLLYLRNDRSVVLVSPPGPFCPDLLLKLRDRRIKVILSQLLWVIWRFFC